MIILVLSSAGYIFPLQLTKSSEGVELVPTGLKLNIWSQGKVSFSNKSITKSFQSKW